MTILLNNQGGDNASWARELASLLPDLPIAVYPEITDVEAIRVSTTAWDLLAGGGHGAFVE